MTGARSTGLLWPTAATLAALAVLIALGAWQWQRKAWKEELIATIASRAAEPPLPPAEASVLKCSVADDTGLSQSCDFRHLKVRGTFNNIGERHVFAGRPPGAAGQEPGYWIFTPFQPEGSAGDGAIFVNRGFVPGARKAAETRREGQIEGPVEIEAQVRSRQPRTWFDGTNDAARNTYYVRDPVELGAPPAGKQRDVPVLSADGSRAFYLELLSPPPPGGLPQPLAGHLELPNRHLEYALTWWGLAMTLVAVYGAFAVGRWRERQPHAG